MKEKLKKIWFVMLVVSVLVQTTLTFFMLYRKSYNKLLSDIIIVLCIAYVLAFLLITFLSLPNKKISREAMNGYKRSQKVAKRVLTLLMLVMSVMNFITAGGSGVDLVLSVVLIVYNLIVIYIDSLVSRIKEKFTKEKRKQEREELNSKVRAYRVGQGNLSEGKKKGDKNEEKN